eukprot:TRINITY_DN6353_c0_g1_i1.p1 TRINITY_DN6353_c0_g1~~TRINITY_DN6353_c0_g1_i1.p1  ORF type:complete len:443 (+),score=142.77 TRINITY_DN6353_c0_g1_i1:157-1485(+)
MASEDVKDILGLKDPNAGNGPKLGDIMSPKKPKPKKEKKARKPEGVSREVFALTESTPVNIGQPSDAAVSLVPTTTLPPPAVLKEKLKLPLHNKAVAWAWKPFRSSARKDSAVFHHWAKAADKSDDHAFVKFNKKITVFEYTNEQYEKYFTDPNWTKEETDELWDLIKRFDLRFIVVADRFQGQGNKSLDDLKHRYYTVSKKLLELNADEDEDISKHPLMKFVFKYDQEVERKQQIEKLLNRTEAEMEEERRLVVEFKRIETNLQKHSQKKKLKAAQALEKKKKLKHDYDGDDGYPKAAVHIRKEKSSGAFVRSHMILSPLPVSQKTAKKVDDLLIEMGVGLRPMPTAAISKIFNEIRQDVVSFVDLQKRITQKEYQVQLLKGQRAGFAFGGGKASRSRLSSSMDSFSDDFDMFETPKPRKRFALDDSDKKKKKKKLDRDYY